ncbi:uncharacterized protein SPAPADRAFT_68654 [Spathaspora passalidarum NRRL Y-27907]|uniref:Uncharacterized protein n=1 Tax=Spathaspora passalidarum (strain NRRL Y-27907 / 11-Y1) TaxID=619300 RepID=G3AUL8_SPAPN|nr:uncharacterized protein SPAPADRAFT_68654 [Spathaspora passalidarum NRRL Y-27907]EGW30574.1 hypothetical protein SPAPADRAFT_68654 [Spathaspora passalidarum NRRL Y-27907]
MAFVFNHEQLMNLDEKSRGEFLQIQSDIQELEQAVIERLRHFPDPHLFGTNCPLKEKINNLKKDERNQRIRINGIILKNKLMSGFKWNEKNKHTDEANDDEKISDEDIEYEFTPESNGSPLSKVVSWGKYLDIKRARSRDRSIATEFSPR